MAMTLCFTLLPTSLAFADANKLYVTPTTSQMNINTTFTVNVRSYSESDQSVGSANGMLNYSSVQLQVTGISLSGSDYGSPSITQGSSSIGFTASRNPAPSGNAQVFAVTFKAKAAGTATVSFTNDSLVNNTTTSYSAGTYTITDPNPPTSTPSSTPKPSTTPKPTPVTTPPVTTQEPSQSPNTSDTNVKPDPTGIIDGVVVNPLYSSATVSWKINANNPTSTISYGPSLSQLDKQGTVKKKDDGTFTTTLTGLTPGLRYSFTIAGSGTGTASGSYSGTIVTQGFPVVISITENNIAVKSAQIKIGSSSYSVTGGKITLGLAAGSYSGTIVTDTASLAINLTVEAKNVPADGNAPEAQPLSFNLVSSPLEGGPGSSFSIFAFIGVLIGGTAILGIAFFIFVNIRRRRFEADSYSSSYTPTSTVIVEDGYDWHNEEVQQPVSQPPLSSTPSAERETQPSVHTNSVYLNEEEPLDMFERANLPPASPTAGSLAPTEKPQSPSSLHSTTP